MEKQRPSFLIYKDSFEVLQELSDEDLGKVFRMIFEYTIYGVIPDKKDKNYIAFSFIKLHLDRDNKKYSDIIERNKLNGSKGGRPLESRVNKSLSGKQIPKHSNSHWVYLIKDEESGQVKVGETKNLYNRRQTIKRNSSKLFYIDFFEVNNYDALEIEKAFKNQFKNYHASGDWFDFSHSDIEKATGYLKNHPLIKKADIDRDIVIDRERDIEKESVIENNNIKPNYKKWTADDFKKDITINQANYSKDMLIDFYTYWSENDANGKMKFQLQKTWETKKRLVTWSRNNFNKKPINGSHNYDNSTVKNLDKWN